MIEGLIWLWNSHESRTGMIARLVGFRTGFTLGLVLLKDLLNLSDCMSGILVGLI